MHFLWFRCPKGLGFPRPVAQHSERFGLRVFECIPTDSAERNDMAGAVREAIQTLPDDLRSTVLQFEYQELGYEEIGGILKCTPKAVETRLYRARKILREALSRWKVGTNDSG